MTASEERVGGVKVDTRHWIGGRRVGSADSFTDLSPIDEQPLAEIASGGEAEAAAAVRAAAEAFPGWAATPPGERAALLHSGEDEGVALAISTRYGLAATIFTGDHARAERVSARLRAWTVWVNCFFVRDLRAPFGGAGQSDIGREGGTWSFDFYCDVKNTVFAPGGWQPSG